MQKLQEHQKEISTTHLADLFDQDTARFDKMSFKLPGMLIDFSKQHISNETLRLLVSLAEEKEIDALRHDMFTGAPINTTENRAVLHTALRAPKNTETSVDGKNVTPDIHRVLERMGKFADKVRGGHWYGHSGKKITDIVNIGIGGSSLGPKLATEALTGFHHARLKAHYVSNVEASELHHVLHNLSPETTLFLIASKTFTTAETMQNAHIARNKVVKYFNDEQAVEKHFVALSTNSEAVEKFGITLDSMFPFWDWVGGRYSTWSAIGLSTMIMIGPEHFTSFLAGAHIMDEHFKTTPLEKNIPVLMGLIAYWNRQYMQYPATAAIPYHSGLKEFAAWLQQADMESNGKSIDKEGNLVTIPTGALVFGEPGTDSQHSFFQWLHQGTDIVPVDFIAAVKTPYGSKKQQNMLLANCLAQSSGLMKGQENTDEPHRSFAGNRPSTTILLDELNPKTLGMLLALYEHKVFVQGAMWGINSFDQFGVQLGKVIATTIQDELDNNETGAHDSSTTGLMSYIQEA